MTVFYATCDRCGQQHEHAQRLVALTASAAVSWATKVGDWGVIEGGELYCKRCLDDTDEPVRHHRSAADLGGPTTGDAAQVAGRLAG